jgi:hypothetical protein
MELEEEPEKNSTRERRENGESYKYINVKY